MKPFNTMLVAGVILSAIPAKAGNPSNEAFEKDRKAILGMSGGFEVNFFFHETLSFRDSYETIGIPYKEEAFETVKVAEDSGTRIVLQHVLQVDRVVVKHWSQEWTYEDREVLEFQGHNSWVKRSLPAADAKASWTQRVTGTADEPRYESTGKWVHHPESSEWTSGTTSRPLPRREYSTRSDYDLLSVTNRQTVTASGWYHEQDNTKWVKRDGNRFPLCREAGLNRYIRVSDGEFTKADGYWEKTAGFWKQVRAAWDEVAATQPEIVLRKKVDGSGLHESLSGLAKRVTGGETVPDSEIRALIGSFTTETEEPTKP